MKNQESSIGVLKFNLLIIEYCFTINSHPGFPIGVENDTDFLGWRFYNIILLYHVKGKGEYRMMINDLRF